jgi:hypothetical protein
LLAKNLTTSTNVPQNVNHKTVPSVNEKSVPLTPNCILKQTARLSTTKNSAATSEKLALPCSPVDIAVAALCGGLDVLIHAKEIGGIVRTLDGRQALVVVPIARFDALLALFHHEIHVRAAR